MPFMKRALQVAQDAKADLVIQVGDFGFWPNATYAAGVNKAFKKAGMPLGIIKGNHDSPRDAQAWMRGDLMDPGLTCIPNGTVEVFDEVRVGFMGGAVSIDQKFRVENKSWWADEVPSDDEFELAKANGPVDVWVTHDAVDMPPGKPVYRFGPKIDTECSIMRHKMTLLREALKPRLHIHGHWHYRYACAQPYGRTIGLDCECDAALLLVEFNENGVVVG